MSKLSFYLIVVVMCGCALQAAAAPRHNRLKKHAVHIKKRNSESSKEQVTITLPEVLNKTVCPIEQVIDYDPERIPRRIKMLKCAATPSPVCQQKDIMEQQACCGQKKLEKFEAECVEVHDYVVVSDLSGGTSRLRTMEVAVGCTCMIRPTNSGVVDPS